MTKGSAASKNLEDKNSSQLDIKSIMEEIRKRISEDVEANKDKAPAFLPIQADLSKEGNRKAGELLYSEELRHLNQNYLYPSRLNLDSIKSHRPGILGKLIVKFKRKVVSILWQNLLQDYFNAEREYQANLVRFLNDVSKYVDERDAAGFWQLVHKVDVDTSKALERVEQISDSQTAELRVTEKRIFDEINKNIAELSNRIGQLAAKVGSQEAELETLDSVARGLEGIVNRMGKNISSEVASQLDSDQQAKDYSYVLLENRFRGKEEAIAERQKFYSGVFKNSTGTVLDIGAGRGELVNILNQDGINSYGIDLDKGMIEVANEKKIDVRFGDGLAHLRSLADNSLGGVIALQVVEHLTRKQLENLFELCRQKVTKDGKIVFETINPKSILALSSNYFRDPTHIWPLHPDTLKHSMTLAGLNVIEVKYLSPVPVEAQLQEIKYDAGMTPKWGELVKLINNNIVQLNELLYGFQDYCIIAEPGSNLVARILVLGVKVPFTKGGQELLVSQLVKELKTRGHEADVVELPYTANPKEGLLNQAALWRAINLEEVAGAKVDLVIATKFPSYFVKHDKKSLWLVHQHRALYDLYGGRYSDISDDPRDDQLRRNLMEADTQVINECSYIAGISKNVIERLEKYNNIQGHVHYPPLPMGASYRQGEQGDYILSVGRLCAIKRVDLMIKALPIIHPFIKLKIVGTPDEPGIMEYFNNEIDKHHLWDRVEFLGRVDDAELLNLFANALGIYYAPHNEDYGYVTLEGMASGKPIIAAHDSGGVLEFVKHDENGLVLEPTSDAIGHGINSLVENKEYANQLGAAGLEFIKTSGLGEAGWDQVIDGLLSPIS